MNERPPPDPAAARFLVINAARVSGVVLVLVGVLATNGLFDLPEVVGYALIVAGLVDVFALPLVLARRWRTPR